MDDADFYVNDSRVVYSTRYYFCGKILGVLLLWLRGIVRNVRVFVFACRRQLDLASSTSTANRTGMQACNLVTFVLEQLQA